VVALVVAAILVGVASTAIAQSQISVPAEFVRYLSPPGQADHFKRPAAIRADTHHGELLIADPGNNRVTIFDERGVFRFAIDMADAVSYPTDVAVDSEGFIYVLGSTSEGNRIFQFDFDGLFLGEFPMPAEIDGLLLDVRSIAIDDSDRLLMLDHRGYRVCSCDRKGLFPSAFSLVDEGMSDAERQEFVLGTLTASGSLIYVPFSSAGTVRVYSPDGRFQRSIGRPGAVVGRLAFPVAVAVAADGMTLILDKRRFNISCYDQDGNFIGEFGGKGINPGWFYFPSLLATARDGQVVVGQIFENKVQLCEIPRPIRAAMISEAIPSPSTNPNQGS